MRPEDLGERELRLIERAFKENFPRARSAVKEDVEENWGTLPDGPFNTDPIIEPRLDKLSKRPEYFIDNCEIQDGRLMASVTFRCLATIHCKEYQDTGADHALSTVPVSNLLVYDVPVQLVIDVPSRFTEEFEIGDLAWSMQTEWMKRPPE